MVHVFTSAHLSHFSEFISAVFLPQSPSCALQRPVSPKSMCCVRSTLLSLQENSGQVLLMMMRAGLAVC